MLRFPALSYASLRFPTLPYASLRFSSTTARQTSDSILLIAMASLRDRPRAREHLTLETGDEIEQLLAGGEVKPRVVRSGVAHKAEPADHMRVCLTGVPYKCALLYHPRGPR